MNNPEAILFITDRGELSGSPGLCQALKIARAGSARLTVMSLYPDLPRHYHNLRARFEEFVETELRMSLDRARLELGMVERGPEINIVVRQASGIPVAITVIREVISAGYDLVIKDAEPVGGKGFKGIDMTLLRKCPTPVWLARPFSRPAKGTGIMVAVEPESRDAGERELSLGLLRKGAALAEIFEGRLDVVSCWEFEFEKILRNKAWLTIPESELQANTQEVRSSHLQLLDNLIEESGVRCEYRVHHLRGRPEDVIPGLLEQQSTDILVMGSVARTGIPGFFIGNTAENVFERTPCALLAMKPAGFVSPVTLPGN